MSRSRSDVQSRSRPWQLAARMCLAVTVAALVSACAADPEPTAAAGPPSRGSADCTQVVRLGAQTYTEAGFTRNPGAELGEVEVASCSDTGDGGGVQFQDEPATALAWAVEGHPATSALAVEVDGGTYRVFVSDALPEDRAAEIVAGLR